MNMSVSGKLFQSFTCGCNEGYSGDGISCTGPSFNAELANLDLNVTITLRYPNTPVRALLQ